MDEIPFPEDYQLCSQLRLDRSKTPAELCHNNNNRTTLPGQPRVQLNPTGLDSYLREELLTPQLDQLAPQLWLVSTPRSSHISPLHHQAVRGRSITLTETAQLHLIWHYNQIFVKPIPRYMLSYAFWQYLAIKPPCLREAAIGFMRTYSYLVRYETDFSLAQEKGLIPRNESSPGREDLITWDAFARLVMSFDRYDDAVVSPRYSYGELRLTRLNFYSRIFLRKLTFHHIDAQWGTFLKNAIAPFIVAFVIISAISSAMQVEMAVQGTENIMSDWAVFAHVSRWFSVFVLGLSTFTITFVLCLVTWMFFHDLWFARTIMNEKRNPSSTEWRTMKSGVI